MNCSHYKIFDYWKDKIITDDFEIEVFDSKKHKNTGITVIEDWGEPECWGCRKFIKNIYNYTSYNEWIKREDDSGLQKIWELKEVKSKLNRCHIIPKALKGLDIPENLFLLCHECHYLSPDTIYKKAFFMWIYERRNKFDGCINGFSINEVLKNINKYKKMLNIEYPVANNFSLKNLKNKTNTHGSTTSQSTVELGILFSCIQPEMEVV